MRAGPPFCSGAASPLELSGSSAGHPVDGPATLVDGTVLLESRCERRLYIIATDSI